MKPDLLSLLKAVFESTTDGLLIVDLEGQVLEYNRRFQELWKIPTDLLQEKNDQKLLNFILDQLDEPEAYLRKVQALYKDSETISEDQIKFKDGRVYDRFSRPLKMNDITSGRVWSFRDVTEHHQREQVLTAITDLSPDIISIIAPDGKLRFNSKAAERIHGYSPEEMVGEVTTGLVHPEDQAAVSEKMKDLLSAPGRTGSVQYRYKNKDGTYSWMEATACNQIENVLIKGIVTISRDITARKKLEEALNTALKLRDEFISITSHELKTPLTSMKLQLQMLKRSKEALQPSQNAFGRAQDLDKFIGQVQVLQRLIDDLLSITRMRSGLFSLDLKLQNFSETVFESIEMFRDLLENAGCELSTNIEPLILLNHDKLRFQQVIGNLLTNAAKYAPGKPVEVLLRRTDSTISISVRDHGPGVPLGLEQKIFGLFERADRQDYIPGLGVGLYLSKYLVEQHGGEISLERPADQGARFIINLPCSST
jgi:two-component system, sensor histidine kinase and response regulator